MKLELFTNVSTSKTVEKMTEFIHQAHRNPVCRMMTVFIVGPVIKNGRDFDAIAFVVYDWITNRIQYFRDPHNVEFVRDWENIVKTGEGDCDDFTVLSCSMLGSVGIKTRIVICQVNKPVWNHVYCEYYSPKEQRWIAFDASVVRCVGWEAENILDKKYFPI